MNANIEKMQSLIASVFTSAVEKLVKGETETSISDLYVQVDEESGELQIYDDEEHLIDKTVIFDWINSNDEEIVFNKRVSAAIKPVLTSLASKDLFDDSHFLRPFSISLTDDDFVVIEELLFLDDDMLLLDDPLLNDLDADLDNFLSDLLADVK